MVKIPLPGQGRAPRHPLHHYIPAGTRLFRIFNPNDYAATPLGFRWHGPHSRFDHHRGHGPPAYAPADDPERAVYYAAFSLSGCVVEVCGDLGSIVFGDYHVAKPEVTRDLDLLDLRREGAMRAGSVAALAKTADRSVSQAWARHFYEYPGIFGAIDGILYFNAHNDEEALVLFERAAGALACPATPVLRLDDPDLRTVIEEIAWRNNLVIL
ncbi:MAG TPA: RES family NAD+ phosphorylase [Chloroflexota bacterium]|nr:RES family NAD+ phosphorylase [Chloroflexota bacterium]